MGRILEFRKSDTASTQEEACEILPFKDFGVDAWNRVSALAYEGYLRGGRGVVFFKYLPDQTSEVRYIVEGSAEFKELAEGFDAEELNRAVGDYDVFEQLLFMWECHAPLLPKSAFEQCDIYTVTLKGNRILSPVEAWEQANDEALSEDEL